MGNSDSFAVCPYCATELNLPSSSNTTDHCFCARCHGAVTKNTPRRSRMSLLFPNHRNNIIKDEHTAIALRDLHIYPFIEDVHALQSEEKESKETISSDYLIDKYLKPYFDANGVILSIRPGNRIRIQDIEFKVISCYPPNGVATASSSFHLKDNHNAILTVHRRSLKQMRILPTESSLKAQNMPGVNIKALFESHLKPYLEELDHVGNARHFIQNEVFTHAGIEWRVMECDPLDGFIDTQTIIHCDGGAISDIDKIYIRPKYDSLPAIDKHCTTAQMKEQYICPMLYGRFMYFDNNALAQWSFEDIEYIAYGIEPDAGGIVTCCTVIDCKPVKSTEIIHIQQQMDAAFALKLQQEEYHHIAGDLNRELTITATNDYPLFIPPFGAFRWSTIGGIGGNVNVNHRRMKMKSIGLSQQLLNTLPTHAHSIINTKDVDSATQDVISCRICLYPYQDGEQIKILPCLHKYHSMCIDHWLRHSVKCPICMTSVFD